MPILQKDNISIPYFLDLSNRKRRTITLGLRDGKLVIKAPSKIPWSLIEKFVWEQWGWILKQLQNQKQIVVEKKQFQTGESINLFDKIVKFEITSLKDISNPKVYMIDDTFQIIVPESFSQIQKQTELRKLLKLWYIHHADDLLKKKVEYFSSKLNVKCKKVRIKEVSTIWGSCSRNGDITLNWRLLLAPEVIADYVVIHEVSHLIHHHHRKTFWDCVFSLDREYKAHIKWLKKNGNTLHI
ncbi:MAG: SprT family zinc-dependent metalloprotease [Candidatus Roizmanbacteria bacterium]